MNLVAARHWVRLGRVSLVLIGAAVVVALLYLLRPPPVWTPPNVSIATTQRTPARPAATVESADLAVIWQRDLRQPLVDLPPAAPSEPKLAIRLVGTAVEPDRRYALFQLSNSTTVVKALGTRIEDFEVVAIERGRARLRGAGREYELTVPWYDRLPRSETDHGR
jgi:hypothetical protein